MARLKAPRAGLADTRPVTMPATASSPPPGWCHVAAGMVQLVRGCRWEAMRREIARPALTPRQPRLRSALVVLVVAAPPDASLVAARGGAVEPLEHAPEAVQSARIGGIGV